MSKELSTSAMTPRRRIEQLVSNPNCETNVASAVLKVGVQHIAAAYGVNPRAGLSSFAFARGRSFEKYILRKRDDGTTALGQQLVRKNLISSESPEHLEIVDLRVTDFEESRIKSIDFLRSLPDRQNKSVQVLASGFRFVTSQIHPAGDVEIDLLLCKFDDELNKWTIRIGEVKVYPDRAGFTDKNKLATARAQAGLYRNFLAKFIESVGVQAEVTVLDRCFFVFTKATGAGVSVWANEDISEQDVRAENALSLMRSKFEKDGLADLAQDDEDVSQKLEFLKNHTQKSYNENCWNFCDLSEYCLRQLVKADDPLVLGGEAKQELGDIPIERILALLNGASDANELEADIVERFRDADIRLGGE
jgi:hypothetical protein